MGLEPLYVCVHVPEFPAQAALRLRTDLHASAVAVTSGEPPLEQVCSANLRARRMGVADAMTRAELESFADVCVLRRSVTEERNARAVVLQAASAFTPRMEVQPARGSALDFVLDMSGSRRIFGEPDKVVARIAAAMQTLQFSVRLAASSNLNVAVCLAPETRTSIVVPRGEERRSLQPLPLRALLLTPEQSSTLELWGLRTLGDLAALPETQLVVRLGQPGKRLLALARGEYEHLMVPQEAEFRLSEYVAFDAPVELLDSLLFVMGPMLEQLLARAQQHALALASVTATLGLDGEGEHVRTIKPALPVAEQSVILKLLHLDLQAHPPAVGVVSLRVDAEPGDRSKVQLGLFAPQTPEPMRLDVTLARIAALVGEDRVGRARLVDTHATDDFVMERFTVTDARTTSVREPAKPAAALRRCRPPASITMQLQQSQPSSFFYEGVRYAVGRALGPWRKSGAWWSAGVWSCEEWDLCADSRVGDRLLCIVAHDLLRGHWRMEAIYD